MISSGTNIHDICNICYDTLPTYRCKTCTHVVCSLCLPKLTKPICPQCRKPSSANEKWHCKIDGIEQIEQIEQIPNNVVVDRHVLNDTRCTWFQCWNVSFECVDDAMCNRLKTITHRITHVLTMLIVCAGIGALAYIITGNGHILDGPRSAVGIFLLLMLLMITGLLCIYIIFVAILCISGCCLALESQTRSDRIRV